MNEQQYRDVLLAKAIETAAPDEPALLSPGEREGATAQTLHESRTARGSGKRQLESLIVQRAGRLLQAAGRREPQLKTLRTPAHSAALWLGWIPIVALIAGFASEKISEPHRLNLITMPLLAILSWNLCMYLIMLVRALLAATRRQGGKPLLLPTATLSRWWSKSALGIKSEPLRAAYLRFLQDWADYSQQRHSRQLQASLHLGAAALALGVVLGLCMTGLFTEYRIGWESTWLGPEQMHALANLLTWPARQLLDLPAWSLAQIETLQQWPAGSQQNGRQWIAAYSLLLLLVVVLPRMLLAAWQLLRCAMLARRLHLPLSSAYFQRLARDFSSDSTVVVIHPFSMAMSQAREQLLQNFVRQQLGSSARLVIAPSLAYGDSGTAGAGYFRRTLESHRPSLSVLLFNLAATPEEEAHGTALRQFSQHAAGARAVWIYGFELAHRLGSGEAAHQRLAERRLLWQLFTEAHDMEPVFIPQADSAKARP